MSVTFAGVKNIILSYLPPPPDLPPGKNLFIKFCKLPINSSKLGGSLLEPDPLLSPLLGPPEPQGDWLFKISFVNDMSLYIVTFIVKTS